MGKLIDLSGQRFGRLTVIERTENHGKQVAWLCKCECGNVVIVESRHLMNGGSKSCGCLKSELVAMRNKKLHTKHGLIGSRIYRIWGGMKSRCSLESHTNYRRYGGRGIDVCEEWSQDFQAFYDWAMANGYQENLSIDRIDNDKGYSPDNCRWVSQKEQCRNRGTNKYITIMGKTKALAAWCEELNIKPYVFYKRIKYGWSLEEALGIIPRGSKKTK